MESNRTGPEFTSLLVQHPCSPGVGVVPGSSSGVRFSWTLSQAQPRHLLAHILTLASLSSYVKWASVKSNSEGLTGDLLKTLAPGPGTQ